MDLLSPTPCPYLTADLPGIGGVIKRFNEDFEVEEIPLYEPSGTGTHVYFGIEKNGLSTPQAVQMIARALHRDAREIGYAGMKDAHAVARQTFSLEHVDPDEIQRLSWPGLRVLWTRRHTNKLKMGHLRGNQFIIMVRQADPDAPPRVQAILDVLARRGVPNYFGEQRFGRRGDNAAVGLAVLRGDFDEAVALVCGRPGPADTGDVRTARGLFDRGDFAAALEAWPRASQEQRRLCAAMQKSRGDARRAWRAIDRKLALLYVSALQSALFNRVLAWRIETIDRLINGDVAWKHANGALFLVEDAAAEQPRCDAFEISPSGPLFGRKMKAAQGEPGQSEARALAESGLTLERLAEHRHVQGARRPLRFRPQDCRADQGTDARGPHVRISFALDSGCYATTVLREICKTPDAGTGP